MQSDVSSDAAKVRQQANVVKLSFGSLHWPKGVLSATLKLKTFESFLNLLNTFINDSYAATEQKGKRC